MPEDLAQEAALALLVLVPVIGRIADDASRAAGGISATQASHLAVLLHQPLRGVQIAQRLRTTRASVAEVLRRLESAGLVCSEPDPDDGRARLVALTPAGRAAIETFGAVTTGTLGRALDPLPPESLVALRDAARALAPILSTQEVAP